MSVLTNSINANATTPLLLVQGGTSASLVASNGGVVYSTATAMAILAGTATANQVLLSGSSAAPSWSTATYPATTTVSQLLYSSATNVISGLPTANSAVLSTSSAGVPAWSASLTNGQLQIGSTGATPAINTLTAGTGISITNGAGSITITNTQTSSTMWSVVAVNTALVAGSGYFANSAGQLTFTLPVTAAVGDTFQICAVNTGGWITAQAAGQQITLGNQSDTSGATGTIASNSTKGDWIEIVCSVANTTFYANLKQGEATVT